MVTEMSPLIYAAQSKRNFYCRDAVCEYVLRAGGVPVNPFRVFDYFLSERVATDLIRAANRVLLRRCDEVWVFGEIADGVFAEIEAAFAQGKAVRIFTIDWRAESIAPVELGNVRFEEDLLDAMGGRERLLEVLARGLAVDGS